VDAVSQAQVNPTPLLPGPLTLQARAIIDRLQIVFPPSYYEFQYLPANITGKHWESIVQGNQPMLGLAFLGLAPVGENPVMNATAMWMVLCSVRRAGKPQDRFLSGKIGGKPVIGALDFASTAVALLHRANLGTGTGLVTKVTNAVSEAWAGDSAVMSIDLRIPLTLPAAGAFTTPEGLGLFQQLSTQWNEKEPGGGVDTYSSVWVDQNE
jgi:hypothetical protein